ncbi:MAG: SEL1-like repeat protein, partial [Deltaproteobacteria bacterium]|nr:SEL1-like repeat protein [Deltaproteobacteria bacterium]
ADPAKAAEWWEKAASQGHAHAQLNLGQAYSQGQGVLADPAKAAEWLRKAAGNGAR